ncbi:MAG: SDR family oxidoreductase [Actinobacteria bacterium]|nr:SDR family oxidoreductase [Actinomycetota bacterium]
MARVDVDGSIAVLSGGSSGIGRHLAVALARRGATVVVVARRADRLAEVSDELRSHSRASRHAVCDVSDRSAWTGLLADVEEDHGRIDLLLNVTAIERRLEAIDATVADYREVMEVNYLAAVAGTLAVLPGMRQRRRGHIVNVSSDSARAPTVATSSYAASKAALSAFTEAVALEHHGTGVHLHVLYPGWVPTPMGLEAVEAGMPMPPRLVRRTPDQVVDAVLDGLGGPVDINLARAALAAPLVKAIAPRLHRRMLLRQSGRS